MTKDELCTLLNGREYTKEISSEIARKVRENNLHWTYNQLVIVFGGSDDLMEFRGAIDDEVGCYDGGKAFLNSNGLLENHCEDDDCPYFADQKKRATTIEALRCAEPGISWTYKTDIPHSIFEIMKDGEVYCRGIVFNLADVKGEQMECIATTKQYDHKAVRAKMTPSEIDASISMAHHQYCQAARELPIDCAGVGCERKRVLLHMHRCWFCGKYFCPQCSNEHFGNRFEKESNESPTTAKP